MCVCGGVKTADWDRVKREENEETKAEQRSPKALFVSTVSPPPPLPLTSSLPTAGLLYVAKTQVSVTHTHTQSHTNL